MKENGAILDQNLIFDFQVYAMKCFYYLRDKSRSSNKRSAPELKDQEKLELSGPERVTKSSCSSASPHGIPELYEKGHNLGDFFFAELKWITSDFSRLLKIGEGGFGSMCNGTIKLADGNGNSVFVAMKRLNKNALQYQTRFISQKPAKVVLSSMEVVAQSMGFKTHFRNYKIFEVAPTYYMVDIQKAAGDTGEYLKFYTNFSSNLEDIIWKSPHEASKSRISKTRSKRR